MRVAAHLLSVLLVLLAGAARAAFDTDMTNDQCTHEVITQVESGIPVRQIILDAREAGRGVDCVFVGLNDALVDRSVMVEVLLDAGYTPDDVRAAALAKGWPADIIENLVAGANQPVNPIMNPDLSVANGGGEDVSPPPVVSPN